MAKFSKRSLKNLAQVDPVLQVIMKLAIHIVDFSVVCGHRGKEEQNKAFAEGFSKLKWANSKHNSFPSLAVDIIPYPSGYKATPAEWAYLAGVIKGITSQMNGWAITWGGHWKKFIDKPHFEIKKSS
jgi:hypothetical protein